MNDSLRQRSRNSRRPLLALGVIGIIVGTVLATLLLVGRSSAPTPTGSRSRPMERAILTGDVEAVRRLVVAGDAVNQRMFRGETPALMSASVGAWDIVLYLLKEGADPTLRNMSGTSLATYARDSRIAPDTREGRALEKVKVILRRRGLVQDTIYKSRSLLTELP